MQFFRAALRECNTHESNRVPWEGGKDPISVIHANGSFPSSQSSKRRDLELEREREKDTEELPLAKETRLVMEEGTGCRETIDNRQEPQQKL